MAAKYGRMSPAEMRAARIPEECRRCGDWNVAYRDPDGVWVECACDAGYVR